MTSIEIDPRSGRLTEQRVRDIARAHRVVGRARIDQLFITPEQERELNRDLGREHADYFYGGDTNRIFGIEIVVVEDPFRRDARERMEQQFQNRLTVEQLTPRGPLLTATPRSYADYYGELTHYAPRDNIQRDNMIRASMLTWDDLSKIKTEPTRSTHSRWRG